MIGFQGLRGITILEASGDFGVGAGCLAPDNKTVEFNPLFPATCPYLTSVGGTVNVSPRNRLAGQLRGFQQVPPSSVVSGRRHQEVLYKVDPATRKYCSAYTDFAGRGFPDVAEALGQSKLRDLQRGQSRLGTEEPQRPRRSGRASSRS